MKWACARRLAACDGPGIVAELGEDAGRAVGELVELADVALARIDAQEAPLDQRVELERTSPAAAERRTMSSSNSPEWRAAGVLQRDGELSTRSSAALSVGAGSATARSSRFTAAGAVSRASERRPAPSTASPPPPPAPDRRARARFGSAPPARGGSRRARPPPRARRASAPAVVSSPRSRFGSAS